MKSNGNFRKGPESFGPEDALQKAAKLAPAKKSGKEKQSLYRSLDEGNDEDYDFKSLQKRESILDYYDDGIDTEDEWEEMDEDDASDLEEDWADEWSDGDEEEE